jgi:YVTN family beta-propeller protein
MRLMPPVAIASLVLCTPVGAQSRNLIFVSNEGSNDISVIDTRSAYRATIPVGSRPRGIAVSPDGKRVYVAR